MTTLTEQISLVLFVCMIVSSICQIYSGIKAASYARDYPEIKITINDIIFNFRVTYILEQLKAASTNHPQLKVLYKRYKVSFILTVIFGFSCFISIMIAHNPGMN
jgi:hypothetical protein